MTAEIDTREAGSRVERQLTLPPDERGHARRTRRRRPTPR